MRGRASALHSPVSEGSHLSFPIVVNGHVLTRIAMICFCLFIRIPIIILHVSFFFFSKKYVLGFNEPFSGSFFHLLVVEYKDIILNTNFHL